MSVWTLGYSLYILGYYPILLSVCLSIYLFPYLIYFFFAQIVSILAIGSSLNSLLCLFIVGCFDEGLGFGEFFVCLIFSIFLTFWNHKMLQAHLVFPASVLESIISIRNLVLFIEKMILELGYKC